MGSICLGLWAIGCGDDTGGAGGGQGSGGAASSSASATVTDAAATTDAASSASSTAVSSSSTGGGFVCDTEGWVSDSDFAVQDAANGFGAYSGGVYPGDGTYDSLDIEWYDGRMVVGSDTIIGANYNTCTLCVLVFINCDSDSDPVVCEKTFLANAGTVELDSVTDDLVGTLRDVEMVQVTIDADLFSDPVPDGETYCIDEYSFDVPIQPYE